MLEVLLNADVYAPEALGIRHLVIAGERIVWMGEARPELPAQLGARITDVDGRRLIPGLIDGHAHVTGGGFEAGYASRVPAPVLSRYTSAGVTTVIGLLGTDDLVHNTAELLAHTRGLVEQGISAWCWTGGYHVPPATLTGSVRGDIVHLDRVIGVGELAISDHRSSQPTLDELLRVASEAHVAGLMSGKAGIVHLHLGDGPRGLALVRKALSASELPPRVFQPTHVNRKKRLFEEALELAGVGCHIDITAFPVADGEDAWPAEIALLRYLDGDRNPARVTVSSDGGGCLPVFDEHGRVASMGVGDPAALAATLKMCLDAGRPLEQVLPAFTSNWADLLRLPRKGRIAVGADADLCLLDEQDRVSDTMARGRWHVREAGVLVRGAFES